MVLRGHCQRLEYISINNSWCCCPDNVLNIKFSIFEQQFLCDTKPEVFSTVHFNNN